MLVAVLDHRGRQHVLSVEPVFGLMAAFPHSAPIASRKPTLATITIVPVSLSSRTVGAATSGSFSQSETESTSDGAHDPGSSFGAPARGFLNSIFGGTSVIA